MSRQTWRGFAPGGCIHYTRVPCPFETVRHHITASFLRTFAPRPTTQRQHLPARCLSGPWWRDEEEKRAHGFRDNPDADSHARPLEESDGVRWLLPLQPCLACILRGYAFHLPDNTPGAHLLLTPFRNMGSVPFHAAMKLFTYVAMLECLSGEARPCRPTYFLDEVVLTSQGIFTKLPTAFCSWTETQSTSAHPA